MLPTPPQTPTRLPGTVWQRKLGDTELSYFLPSRTEGVNDMYLCIDFTAPRDLVTDERVLAIWAILRTKHPLLAAEVCMQEGEYDSASFRYVAAQDAHEELARARENLRISVQTKEEVILDYLNGPRLLSKEQPAYLLFGQRDLEQAEFHFCLCTTHYLGDGMALHKTANEFFSLLGEGMCDAELFKLLDHEWTERYSTTEDHRDSPIPQPLEEKLPPLPAQSFARYAARVDYENLQRKTIGGHVMPRKKHGPRRTTVPTVPFSAEETGRALKKCKKNGVTISHAIFALCNMVWLGIKPAGGEDLPTMMYAAANLRSYFSSIEESHFYLAVTYFNIMLPSFIPRDLTPTQTLWLRSQSVKRQMNAVVGSKMYVSRARITASQRASQAKTWAAEDDARDAGESLPPSPPPTRPAHAPPKVPSNALIGLSMLGNLDAIYAHKAFPDLQLHGLTTGSRQRGGAMLLFAYTFAGKLWLSLGYDENGFERVIVQKFWQGLLDSVRENLL
ncbi:hypothetical protein DACRYDRAFT_46425 [Dacryopinax primogenitus]|uniref:CoA-dependent acyltransferase n=1 Tax=Dacryopinax primogenitus (strain DJM 731) TaxID=1858805 RepID=M5GGG7_DACPD|nr:uncharacterized protein DACRYDRAFT_46425 [Dacryopinax primogenitus]EJU05458.1 hypothetical protein DACRYDRAFT_46425 [Dacryopinax primogenitus]